MAQPSRIPIWWNEIARGATPEDLERLYLVIKAGGASVNDRNAVSVAWGRILDVAVRKTQDKRPTIMWDVNKYYRLKKMYEEAVDKGYSEIRFDGHLLVTAYAKYLLEYLKYKLDDDAKVNGYGSS